MAGVKSGKPGKTEKSGKAVRAGDSDNIPPFDLNTEDMLRKERPELNEDTATKLLANIFDACGCEPSNIPLKKLESYSEYRREKYSLQKLLIVIILVIFLLLPICFITPDFTISEIADRQAGRRIYDVTVRSFLPVNLVAASVDDHAFPVFETGDGTYTVEPTVNGKMKVKVVLANRQYAVKEIEVSEIDFDKPVLISQNLDDGKLYIYVSDGEDGSGINWEQVHYETNSGSYVTPVEIDEIQEYAAFTFPKESVNFYFPDNNGNILQLLFTPQAAPKADTGKNKNNSSNTEEELVIDTDGDGIPDAPADVTETENSKPAGPHTEPKRKPRTPESYALLMEVSGIGPAVEEERTTEDAESTAQNSAESAETDTAPAAGS
ncbi:MAG: hypothetical protein Q4F31_05205 [Eubacteriales bacterium]|nr:hypothetical protein [Eubacteriales bacterium]